MVILMGTKLERLIEESKRSVNSTKSEQMVDSPDCLEESLHLLIERDNPMADAAKNALERL